MITCSDQRALWHPVAALGVKTTKGTEQEGKEEQDEQDLKAGKWDARAPPVNRPECGLRRERHALQP